MKHNDPNLNLEVNSLYIKYSNFETEFYIENYCVEEIKERSLQAYARRYSYF